MPRCLWWYGQKKTEQLFYTLLHPNNLRERRHASVYLRQTGKLLGVAARRSPVQDRDGQAVGAGAPDETERGIDGERGADAEEAVGVVERFEARVDAVARHDVPKKRHRRLDEADGLLCIGTSLAVYSAFRFARRARDDGIPICILNRGPTRCDAEEFPDLTKVSAGVAALAEVVGM